MFETANSDLATVERCSENLAYLFAGNELHFCRSVAANGTIDPCFLLAAYALEQKIDSPVWIVPTYERPQQWVKAFSGIRHLAFAQNITLNLTTVNLPKAGVRRIDQADGPVKEVWLLHPPTI